MLIVGLGGALSTTLRPLILVLLELPPHVDPPNVLAVGLPTFVGLDIPLSIPVDDEGEPTPKQPYSEELYGLQYSSGKSTSPDLVIHHQRRFGWMNVLASTRMG